LHIVRARSGSDPRRTIEDATTVLSSFSITPVVTPDACVIPHGRFILGRVEGAAEGVPAWLRGRDRHRPRVRRRGDDLLLRAAHFVFNDGAGGGSRTHMDQRPDGFLVLTSVGTVGHHRTQLATNAGVGPTHLSWVCPLVTHVDRWFDHRTIPMGGRESLDET
jgi:hypothetical protein